MHFEVHRSHLLFSEGNLKGLKDQVPKLKRNRSWVGEDGFSPLHLAVFYNQVEMCELLLQEGITPDVTEPFTGKTPLHIASYYGHLDAAEALKRFGATLNVYDYANCSPIHYAAMGLHKEMLIFFLKHRISTSLQSNFGNVIDILIRKKSIELVDFFSNINGIEAFSRFCLSDCSVRRSIDDQDWSPFHSAAISQQTEIFELLYRKFPYVPLLGEESLCLNKKDYRLSEADVAALGGDPAIKKLLGVDIDSTQYRKHFMESNWYETPVPERRDLCEAIRYRQVDKIDAIIQSKGKIVLFEREEKTRTEKRWGSLENPNALDFGGCLYSLPFFDYLIDKSVEIPDEEFMTPQREDDLFFNWALMKIHPYGEGFFKRLE